MSDTQSPNPPSQIALGEKKSGRPARSRSDADFRYYIHDTLAVFCFELLGELTEEFVPDLNGCWNTARSTVTGRTLKLDLRRLKSVDEAGKQWLAGMAGEGAVCVPESYLRDLVAGKHAAGRDLPTSQKKTGVLGRLMNALRGLPVETAK